MLNYQIEGTGSPLLLIHGFGISFNIWQNLIPFLENHFRLIMIELPGIGNSDLSEIGQSYYQDCAVAIEELRQSLGIESWSVFSYSAGARAGDAYIRQYPERVERALFLCPAYINIWRALGLQFFVWLDDRCAQLGDWFLSGWRLYQLIVVLGFNGRTDSLADEWMNEISSQPISVLKATLYELPKLGRRPFEFEEVDFLCVWGQHDLVVTRPRRPDQTNKMIKANHSAPLSAAPDIANIALLFLGESMLTNA
jgi:pimeloyl-ACP methyl ester carboxylesterase